ncbi:VOC family protein [Nocardia jinanensis]|uniref:Drug:proton antiporter n=1 Tax=Nocardia jinanensis TaxID=382504 RepID=A0A917RRT8_9NOCA|nr:VOC family protein [Nocardia jinanensis]GGL24251.1 drug:proton antiporter [Nocardia jinanensis]
MPTPNMFIVYVADAPASARFYSDLFDMAPKFESPRFITFELGGGVDLALWSGHPDQLEQAAARTSEVCLNLSGGPAVIDEQFERWLGRGVKVVQEPHDAVFGRTFVVEDPDGNLIRVAPVD